MNGHDTLLYAWVITASLIIGVEMCATSQFRCTNGQCIDMSLRCNDGFDCHDASDEIDCKTSNMCPEGLFRCPSGFCIDLSNNNCTDTTTQQTNVDLTSSTSYPTKDMSTTDITSVAETLPVITRTTHSNDHKEFTTLIASTYEHTNITKTQITNVTMISTYKQTNIPTMQTSTYGQTDVTTTQSTTPEQINITTMQKSTYEQPKVTTMQTSTYEQTKVTTMQTSTYELTNVTTIQISTHGGSIPHENNTNTGIIVFAVLVPVIILVSVALFVRYKRKSQGNIV